MFLSPNRKSTKSAATLCTKVHGQSQDESISIKSCPHDAISCTQPLSNSLNCYNHLFDLSIIVQKNRVIKSHRVYRPFGCE